MSQDDPTPTTPEPVKKAPAKKAPAKKAPAKKAPAAKVIVTPASPVSPPSPPSPESPPSAPSPVAEPTDGDGVDTAVGPAAAGPSLGARLGAEALGAFVIVLFGVGVAIYATYFGGPLSAALAFGIAAIAGVAAWGHISGGHFNPAVTLGAAIAGRTPWADVLPYWLAQVVGGTTAAAVLFLTVPDQLALATNAESKQGVFSAGANGFGEGSPFFAISQGMVESSLTSALVIEATVTAVFVGVILAVTARKATARIAPVAIGLTLTGVLLVAIPLTNGSINPARSTAAAIFSQGWAIEQLWVFWVGPLAGGAIAGVLYLLFTDRSPVVEEAEAADVEATATV